MRHKRILTLILAMIMVFQFIPSDIYADVNLWSNNGDKVDLGQEMIIPVIEKPYPIEYIQPVTAYTKSNASVKFPLSQGTGQTVIQSAVLTGRGFDVPLTIDKSTGYVVLPLKQLHKNGAWVHGGVSPLAIEVTYAKSKILVPDDRYKQTPQEITEEIIEKIPMVLPSTGEDLKEINGNQ